MKPNLLALTFAALVVGHGAIATAQDKSTKPDNTAEQKVAQIQKLLDEPLIDTKDFREQMPMAKFLVALEGHLPKEKKIALRLEEEAFGKELAKLAEAKVRVFDTEKISLRSALQRALRQLPKGLEVDYGIRPTEVVITRPRLAAHRMAYDVRDIVEQMPLLLPELRWISADIYRHLKPTDGPSALVHFVTNSIELQPWETIEILNGTRLVLRASPTRHAQLGELMTAFRRLADQAIVMNARLIEVDRTFFTKEVAPLFAKAKDAKEPSAVLPIEGPLFKKIAQQKVLLESEDIKVRPNRETIFLSQQSVFRYAAGLPPVREGLDVPGYQPEKTEPTTSTGLAGVSFQVRARLSPDRRYVRLQISQNVAQLIGIDKTKKLDVATGKEVEVESPNLRKTSVTGTVQTFDGNPILMPVDYRPADKGKEDKVWLLVARPFIWIEDEVREIRRGGGDLTPQSIWEKELEKVENDETPVPATRLPLDDDTKEILQAIITDVLTNPDLKSTREFYGTAKDKTLTLVDTDKLGWPKEFQPVTHGYSLMQPKFDPFVNQRRVLGIRLDKFDLKQKKSDLSNRPIEICLFNAGGDANGAVIGGCSVYYTPKRDGKKWVVEYEGLEDP